MKFDRRKLFIGALAVGAALFSARQERRPACADGSCLPLPPHLSVPPGNSWPAVESTNAMLVPSPGESVTNR